MPWKRLFRWLAHAAIVCLVLLLIVVGVVLNWVRIDAAERGSDSSFRALALAAGLKDPDASYASIVAQFERQPELAFALLEHDSSQVRGTAQYMLRNAVRHPNDALLDMIAAEMRDPRGIEREFMVELLTIAGQPGARRLAALYRGPEEIDPVLQRAICGKIGIGRASELIPMLRDVVVDPTVDAENRCRAVEVLSCLFKPERLGPDWMEEPFRSRAPAIAAMREMLPKLPDPVANAVKVALKRSEDEDAARQEMARVDPSDRALWPEIAKGDARAALAALSDRVNWWKVGAAADALARNGVKEAIPALRRVAETHWYSPVRKTAQRAIRVLEGKEPYLPPHNERGQFTAPFTTEMFQVEELEKWHKDHPNRSSRTFAESIAEMLEPMRDACFWRFQPRIDQVEYRRPGRLPRLLAVVELPEGRPMHPKHAIHFAGGTLLGYDERSHGGYTVFCRKGAMPQLFFTQNVYGFVSMPFGVLILADDLGTRMVYVAKESNDGAVAVNEFMSLPSGGPFRPLPNGDLRIECEGGDVIITTTGGIRMATD